MAAHTPMIAEEQTMLLGYWTKGAFQYHAYEASAPFQYHLVWDKSVATSAAGTYRLINIYFTGTLSMKSPTALTVIGNGNVIYGVDITKANLLSKNGKPMALAEYKLNDTLRVWGKHLSGGVQVFASEIKNSSVSR